MNKLNYIEGEDLINIREVATGCFYLGARYKFVRTSKAHRKENSICEIMCEANCKHAFTIENMETYFRRPIPVRMQQWL